MLVLSKLGKQSLTSRSSCKNPPATAGKWQGRGDAEGLKLLAAVLGTGCKDSTALPRQEMAMEGHKPCGAPSSPAPMAWSYFFREE